MSPHFSSYYDCVTREDFELLKYLSWHVYPFSASLVKNNADIRRKLASSTSWCHLAARAVATVFADKGLKVADGKFYDIQWTSDGPPMLHYTVHSWCKTKDGSILDVAPVGILSFNPILLARKDAVVNPEWGFVTDRYAETDEVNGQVECHLRSEKFRNGYPVYVSLLRNVRQQVDEIMKKGSRKKK